MFMAARDAVTCLLSVAGTLAKLATALANVSKHVSTAAVGGALLPLNATLKIKLQAYPCLKCAFQMPSVTVKDVNQQEFVKALSAFLKK